MTDEREKTADALLSMGEAEGEEGSRGDIPASPTWPMTEGEDSNGTAIPPIGLNWGVVAQATGIDLRVLQHDGAIVLIGEYFPQPGYFLASTNLAARRVDVGDMALARGYHIGDTALRDLGGRVTLDETPAVSAGPVITADTAPLIGLFIDSASAERARQALTQASLAAQMTVEDGPLGVELHVATAQLPGRVATVIAGQGGAVIAVSGVPVTALPPGGPSATGDPFHDGDSRRGGIGAFSSSPGPKPAADFGSEG